MFRRQRRRQVEKHNRKIEKHKSVPGLEKSGRIVAFCDWNARFCDQKTLCSRNFAPKTRRPGASLRPDSENKI